MPEALAVEVLWKFLITDDEDEEEENIADGDIGTTMRPRAF